MTGDKYLVTQDPTPLLWVAERVKEPMRFSKQATAFCVMVEGKIGAVAVFDRYNPAYQTMAIAIAAEHPRWASRQTVREILAFPFTQASVNRLHCIIHKKNKKSRRLVEGVGFTLEGTHKDFWGEGRGDGCTYRLLRHEWEKGKYHG